MSYQLRIEATVDMTDEDGRALFDLLGDERRWADLEDRANVIISRYLTIDMDDVTDWEPIS